MIKKVWTKEMCYESAIKYNKVVDYYLNERQSYQKAKSNGWLNEICQHMQPRRANVVRVNPSGYWTKERCQEIANHFTKRTQFARGNQNAYQCALNHGWLNEICQHMQPITSKPSGYWNRKRCREAASRCKTKQEFRLNYPVACTNSVTNGWFDKFTKHMEEYVPFSKWNNIETCRVEASKYTNRTKFMRSSPGAYTFLRTNGLLNDICSHMEVNPKWKPMRPDTIRQRWSKDKVIELALQYNNKREFRKNEPNAYGYSLRENFFKELSFNIPIENVPTKEYIIEVASKYSTKKEFINNHPTLYNYSKKMNWWDDIFDIILLNRKEEIRQVVLQYNRKTDFQRNHTDLYVIVNKYGWWDELSLNMQLKKKRLFWSKAKCRNSALKCATKIEFKTRFRSAYNSALENKWIDEICEHMVRPIATSSKSKNLIWTKHECRKVAIKCKSRSEFKEKYRSAYNSSLKFGWMDELCNHMKRK
jgi:hypothetical protein